MKRALVGLIVSAFFLSAAASHVEAQTQEKKSQKSQKSPKKSQKTKKSKTAEQAPTSAAISPALGTLKWGASKEVVQKYLSDQVRERYRKPLAKATDGIEEDRLTTVQNQELKKIRESYVQFDGQTTGWDLGFLREEFTHNNGESMLVSKDSNSQNYYFFINDRLWKWYKALNIEVFEGKSFETFADAIQKKFGKAKDATGELAPGTGQRHWLEWQDNGTRLRAVDQTSFYGFYCLVFEDKDTLGKLASLRKNVSEKGGKTHAMVEAVTSSSNMMANPDESPNIVDRITGRNRTKEQAAAEEHGPQVQGSKPASSSSSSSSSGSSSSPSTSKENKNVKDDLEF
jgi:hypothetical protein